jgi:hypothetical protein
MDSSSDNCNLQFGLVKEKNTQDQFGAWDVDINLPNHIKNQVYNSYRFTLYFTQSNYIVGY